MSHSLEVVWIQFLPVLLAISFMIWVFIHLVRESSSKRNIDARIHSSRRNKHEIWE